MTYASVTYFQSGRVFSRMWDVIGRNLGVFAALALVLSGLPNLALAVVTRGLAGTMGDFGRAETAFGPLFLAAILNMFTLTLLQAALIHGTVSDLAGRRVVIGDCLATAVRNLLPLIGIAIAVGIATLLGFMFFIIPGVIVMLALSVATPAQVVEGHGVFAALSRSGDLTRNHRWAILGFFFAFGAIGLGLSLTAMIFPIILGVIAPAFALVLQSFVVTPMIQAASSLINAVGVASIYFELRTVKEGVGVDVLASAFD